MKVWQVSWETYCDSSDSEFSSWELFETQAAAEASCPEGGTVSEVEVRVEPLATETRYEVRSNRHYNEDKLPEVYEPRPYVVNEQQEDFGLPLTRGFGWWLDGPAFHSANLDEALAAVHAEIDPDIEQERDRLAYIAPCTYEYRCPDHGSLGMSPPGQSVPCQKCHRQVDEQGRRFGRYESSMTSNGDGSFTLSVSSSAGGSTDVDLGPLPEAELQMTEGSRP